MNKILLALLVSAMPLLSSANTLVFTPQFDSASFAVTGYGSFSETGSVSNAQFGSFSTAGTGNGTLTATFIGASASFTNFYVQYGNLLTNDTVGSSTSMILTGAQNPIEFYFDTANPKPADSSTPTQAVNGDIFSSSSPLSFALLDVAGTPEDTYYLGFNDYFNGEPDFNDYVVKLTYATTVPVPASLPLMVSALGLFGFGVSRKRSTK